MKNFSIVVPVYNEGDNIKSLIDEIIYALKKFENRYEIIIVNDGSTDSSLLLLNKFESKKKIVLINNSINKGQSFSVYIGIKNSKYNTIVTLDGDGQNNPKDIIKLHSKYLNSDNLYLVSGYRNKRKDKLNKILASKIANLIRRLFLGDTCPDTGCSIKIFDKNIFLSFPFFDGLHRFISPIFELLNYDVCYLKVDHRRRLYGISKYNNINRALKGIKDMIYVKKEIKKMLETK